MKRRIFDDEHEMFRDSVRSFLKNEIQPHSDKWQEQGIVDRDAYLKAGKQGLLLMWADEEYGGAGVADFRYEQVLIEENARFGDAGFFATLHNRLVGPISGNSARLNRKRGGCLNVLVANTFLPLVLRSQAPVATLPGCEPRLRTRAIITC